MVGMEATITSQHPLLASWAMSTTRSTFTMEDDLAEQARRLGVNISAAARDGVAAAVRSAMAAADRAAYAATPEQVDEFWNAAETWSST